MKVLVTGASGQLGSEVAVRLQQQGHHVIMPGRDEMDFTSPETLMQCIRHHRPEQVVNCAAYTQVDRAESEPDTAFAVNRDAPGRLAEAVAENGGSLLHVSTDFVFDGKRDTPWNETDKPDPLCVYGRSKLAGEQAVMQVLPDATVLRTAWVYGVNGHNFVKTILRVARDGKPLRVVDDQVGTPTWSSDIADVIARLLADGATGLYHYTNAGKTSWYGFARAILEEAAVQGFEIRTVEVTPIGTADWPTPAVRPAFSVLDTGKIESRLSLSIPAWRDSLKKMLRDLYTCADCL
jgi:dTDP-4-dehydrorhamnose reductase